MPKQIYNAKLQKSYSQRGDEEGGWGEGVEGGEKFSHLSHPGSAVVHSEIYCGSLAKEKILHVRNLSAIVVHSGCLWLLCGFEQRYCKLQILVFVGQTSYIKLEIYSQKLKLTGVFRQIHTDRCSLNKIDII